jgi:hypothetical protein
MAELNTLVDETSNDREAHWLGELLALMGEAAARVHTFVRFDGD